MAINYLSNEGLNSLVTKIKALVNAVKETAEGAQADAQTASTEAKYYGTCATPAGTTAKTVVCEKFKLLKGARIIVKFTYANTAGTITMNVNGTGAKSVKWHGGTSVGSKAWVADESCLFAYDGTSWVLVKSQIPAWTDIDGAVPIGKGGTGASSYTKALENLHAAAVDHNHDDVYMKKEAGSAALTTTGTVSAGTLKSTAAPKANAKSNKLCVLDETTGELKYRSPTDIRTDIGASETGHTHDLSTATFTGTLPLTKGGTGATTKDGARDAIGAAAATHSHGHADITTDDTAQFVSKSEKDSWNAKATAGHSHALDSNKLTGTLPVSKGGTGATDAATARTNLGITLDGLGAAASNHNHALTSANLTGTLPISKGGTGATTAAAALTALGGATMSLINVSVDTSWGGSASAGFTKTVSVSGVKSTDVPVVGIVMSSDINAAKLQGAAFANVNRITTANNSITLYAFTTKPTTAFTLQMLIVRKG